MPSSPAFTSVPFPPLPPHSPASPLLCLSKAEGGQRHPETANLQELPQVFQSSKHNPRCLKPRAMTTSSEKPVPNPWNKRKPPGEFEVFLKRIMKTKWKYWHIPDIPEDRKAEFIPFYAPHIATMVFTNKWVQTETWQGKDRVFSKGSNNYCDGIIRSIFFLFNSFWLLIFPLLWYPSPQKKKNLSACLSLFPHQIFLLLLIYFRLK